MARIHIAAPIRRAVIDRALNRCEYCLLPAEWVSIPHHVDHIIPIKHGGTNLDENLAYACFDCNIAKGSDIAAFDPFTGAMTRLFHPRTDQWSAHFQLRESQLLGISELGRSTAHLLKFNEATRMGQRALLIAAKVYTI